MCGYIARFDNLSADGRRWKAAFKLWENAYYWEAFANELGALSINAVPGMPNSNI